MAANNEDFGYAISHRIGDFVTQVEATHRATGKTVGLLKWESLDISPQAGEVHHFYIEPSHRKGTLALRLARHAQRISEENNLVLPSKSSQMTETGFRAAKALGMAKNVTPIRANKFFEKNPEGRVVSQNESLIFPDDQYTPPYLGNDLS